LHYLAGRWLRRGRCCPSAEVVRASASSGESIARYTSPVIPLGQVVIISIPSVEWVGKFDNIRDSAISLVCIYVETLAPVDWTDLAEANLVGFSSTTATTPAAYGTGYPSCWSSTWTRCWKRPSRRKRRLNWMWRRWWGQRPLAIGGRTAPVGDRPLSGQRKSPGESHSGALCVHTALFLRWRAWALVMDVGQDGILSYLARRL